VFVISVKVDQNGRIILPEKILKKYGIFEGSRLTITESKGRIYLTPEKTCEKPSEAMFGSIKVAKPIDDPKSLARDFIRKKLSEDMQ